MREIRTLRSMSGERKRDAGPLAHSSRASPRLYHSVGGTVAGFLPLRRNTLVRPRG